tara:strand:+ start:12 stop:218 length:207 start_codon:yes stop_codon:yes gene_type:complete
MLFISGAEIIIVLLFVVIFFGAKKIPQIARGLGRAIREVRDASNDIKHEIRKSAESVENIDKEKDTTN